MREQHAGASEALGCIGRQERYAQDLLALIPTLPQIELPKRRIGAVEQALLFRIDYS